MVNPVFVQAFVYGVVLFGTIALCGAFQRGFFWKYAKVRTSFGKYLIVKIRTPLRDYFAIGEVVEGFLVYKIKKETIRYSINDHDKVFYRSLNVTWVDVDEEKHCLVKTDFSVVSGFDAPKFESLNVRALMRPTEKSLKDKIILFLLVLVLLGVIIAIFMAIKNASAVNNLATSIPAWLENMRGAVTGSAGVI
jgi:hypothetical protein